MGLNPPIFLLSMPTLPHKLSVSKVGSATYFLPSKPTYMLENKPMTRTRPINGRGSVGRLVNWEAQSVGSTRMTLAPPPLTQLFKMQPHPSAHPHTDISAAFLHIFRDIPLMTATSRHWFCASRSPKLSLNKPGGAASLDAQFYFFDHTRSALGSQKINTQHYFYRKYVV